MTQNTFHGKIDRNVVTIGRKNMGKKTDKSTVGLILGFVKRMQEDHIGAYAAQAAYFLIMSFIPFVLVLTALVQYTPLTYRMLRQAILGFVPLNLQDFVLKVIGKRHAVTDRGAQCDLSCKRNPKLADKQIVFYAVYVSVCARNHHKPSSSGYG